MGEIYSNKTTEQIVIEQISSVVRDAKRGEAGVLPRLRQLLDDHPEIWRHYGDLSAHVEAKWLDLLAGDDACVRESLVRRAGELRQEILGEGRDTSLERLLVERIVTSWLQLRYFDSAVSVATVGVPTTQARFLDQQLHRAGKRHIEAIRALAEVRKLLP